MKSIFRYLLISLIAFSFSLYGEDSREFDINHLETISQSNITALYKDSKGFMWIGSLDGLIRFDGLSSKTYRIKQGENSISSNMIAEVKEDHLGNIWVATFGKGLCKLNPVTEQFTAYHILSNPDYRIKTNDVSKILIDSTSVWLGNRYGIHRITLDEQMEKVIQDDFIDFKAHLEDVDVINVKAIHKGIYGDIWVGLNTRFIQLRNPYKPLDEISYEIYEGHVSAFANVGDVQLLGGIDLKMMVEKASERSSIFYLQHLPGFIICSNNNDVWVGNQNGVHLFDFNNNNLIPIEHFTVEGKEPTLSNASVTCIEIDDADRIWVGTKGGGVNIISRSKNPFELYQQAQEQGSLSSNQLRVIFEDSKQNLWIGTEGGGLSYLKGDDKHNYKSGFGHLDIENYPREYNRVYAVEEQLTPQSDKQNQIIWLGTSFPVFLMALNPATMEEIKQPDIVKKLGFVFTLEVQNDSTLWVGTYGEGIWKLTTNSDGLIKDYKQYKPSNKKGTISSYIVRSILVDKDDNLWIGTDKGLNLVRAENLNADELEFEVYHEGEGDNELSQDYILQLFESSNGKIWMGSMGGGLIGVESLNENGVSFSSVTTNDGLANNSIKGIVEDKEGHLWLSSNHGLSKYNPITGDIINYDVEDGLQGLEFSEIVAASRSNGQLLFGGNNGLNVFYPEQVSVDTIRPRMYLSDLYILNEPVVAGKEVAGSVVLTKGIEYTHSITLKHNQSSFSIGFAGMHYNSPQKNRYQYILEGFDEAYTNATADYRIAKYTNVPAGDYTFKVLASNSDNVWADEPVTLAIKVKPHPLLSLWAYVAYLLALAIILWLIFKNWQATERRKKEILIAGIEKRNAEEMTKVKLRFFTNISHEFRTPLTLITVPLEKLMNSTTKYSAKDRQNLKVIKQNANVMMRLVNQLLEFRKLEQEKLELKTEYVNVMPLVVDVYESFELLAQEKGVSLELVNEDMNIAFLFDPEKIEKVIYNLLSNALKFTPKRGKVVLTVKEEDDRVIISVTDTGKGIKEEEQERIFDRYYQSKGQEKQTVEGTGIGLALTKGLVDLHKGSIELQSKFGEGSTFTISLPKTDDGVLEEVAIANEVFDNKVSEDEIVLDTPVIKEKTNYKLLVVEDNEALRFMLYNSFAEYFEVYQAEDGKMGLELCKKHHPDLVISDVMMPNMDGLQLLSAIKNDEEISHIPVVLLTAKGTVEDQIEGHLSGADAYIPKPFIFDHLYAVVLSTIKNKEKLKSSFQKEIEINPMVISTSPADVKFMERILKLIEDNISDPEFNVDRLAEEHGVSRVQLNRKLKALTGETPIQFMRNIKLKHAAEHLKAGALNVSEVAWEVGYNDIGTFRKRFKELFGVSPSEFAKSDK